MVDSRLCPLSPDHGAASGTRACDTHGALPHRYMRGHGAGTLRVLAAGPGTIGTNLEALSAWGWEHPRRQVPGWEAGCRSLCGQHQPVFRVHTHVCIPVRAHVSTCSHMHPVCTCVRMDTRGRGSGSRPALPGGRAASLSLFAPPGGPPSTHLPAKCCRGGDRGQESPPPAAPALRGS